MKNALIAIVFFLVLGGVGAGLANYYVVTTPTGTYMVAKDRPDLHKCFVNTSAWGVSDYFAFPEIKDAIIDRTIPSHDNLRAKLIAAEQARDVAEAGRSLEQKAAAGLSRLFHR